MSRLARLLSVLLLALAALGPGRAVASISQQSMLEDDVQLESNPLLTLNRLRMLGVQRIRVAVHWNYIAPSPQSSHPPRHFNAADPAAYPLLSWTMWDQIVEDAHRVGIALEFNPMGGAPLWALGPGRPAGNANANWNPSPSMFQAFVHALGERYSGSYDPVLRKSVPGDPNDLPRVSFWSIWNEPDYGPSLAPQGVPGDLLIENSPRMYRNLVDAAWTALHQTGHGGDTFLFGEIAPRGMNYWGVFSGMKPLVFLRAMYCVNASYRPLAGAAAAIRGCPATAAGSRRFRGQNPALFEASGFADHPYMRWYPPNVELQADPNYSSLAEVGNLERALDRLQRVYGSRARLPVWNTEFGYLTSPPKHDNQYEPQPPHYYPWVSPSMAAYYLNWAEYESWRDPRMMSFFQYLLHDPLPSNKADDWGGFASGLLNYSFRPKPTYNAWRLPLYLPVTSARRGEALQVWGCVRPARFAILDTGLPQTVDIQFLPRSGGQFTTLQTATISSAAASCYFEVPVMFPSSGLVRLTWSYPILDRGLGYLDPLAPRAVYSRDVSITLR